MKVVDATDGKISDECDSLNPDPLASPGVGYFIPTFKIEIIFESRTPIGIRFSRPRDDHQDSSIFCPELFKESYRELECSNCQEIFLAHHFEWKVKGFEGPFRSVWGKRHTQCKNCRKQYKAKLYKKKKNLIKQLEKFQITHIGQPDPVAFLTPFSILLEDA